MGEGAPERGVREGISKLSVSVSLPSSTGESLENKADSASIPSARFSARNASSKYDFVKVKVWLGDNADHYYVLSRFLLSRMLTVTKIPNHVAIKIALELKKLLIDNSLLDVLCSSLLTKSEFACFVIASPVDCMLKRLPKRTTNRNKCSQSDLEANLFKLMERRGYGEEYINRYKMMTRAPLAGTPVWAREFNSSEELITEFCRECRIVRKGLAGDLKKAMKDGKPIIIEGIHLDPSIYLMDEDKREISLVRGEDKEHGNAKSDFPAEEKVKCASTSELNSTCIDKEDKECYYEREGIEINNSSSHYLDNKKCPENPSHKESNTGEKDEGPKDPDARSICPVNKAKPAVDPIIVPIVLKMAEFDHKALLEEWISTRTYGENCPVQIESISINSTSTSNIPLSPADQDKLIHNLKTIQNYLCSFESQGLTVVNISATTFPQTLDRLHNYLLECIERGVSAASSTTQIQSEGN
ncbi:hypothetical protein MA16_Dca000721 [Dendrobium catenatum]|uniref:Uncharacterized protein n=1 Tax=Dendrobium catenatum TaxID=906689 RepID=A0A2I0WUP1_9ASPA|nr:hypothetical protein MA16_Dca000721 [Dendrobium catenatum]